MQSKHKVDNGLASDKAIALTNKAFNMEDLMMGRARGLLLNLEICIYYISMQSHY